LKESLFLLTVIVFLFPENDRKDALAFLQKGQIIVAFFIVVIVVLIATIIIMSVTWYYTRKLDKMEIERLVSLRNELQRERGYPTQSSKEMQS